MATDTKPAPHYVTPTVTGYRILGRHDATIDATIYRTEAEAIAKATELLELPGAAKVIAIGRVEHYLTLVR